MQISVIAGTTFFLNYLFENIYFDFLFVFDIFLYYSKKFNLNNKGDISSEIFIVCQFAMKMSK